MNDLYNRLSKQLAKVKKISKQANKIVKEAKADEGCNDQLEHEAEVIYNQLLILEILDDLNKRITNITNIAITQSFDNTRY